VPDGAIGPRHDLQHIGEIFGAHDLPRGQLRVIADELLRDGQHGVGQVWVVFEHIKDIAHV